MVAGDLRIGDGFKILDQAVSLMDIIQDWSAFWQWYVSVRCLDSDVMGFGGTYLPALFAVWNGQLWGSAECASPLLPNFTLYYFVQTNAPILNSSSERRARMVKPAFSSAFLYSSSEKSVMC